MGKAVIHRVEAWHAARTLEVAKINLKYYRRKLDNPPSLFELVALIVCFLPIPIASIFLMLASQNPPPNWMLNWMPHLGTTYPQVVREVPTIVYFINYVLFSSLGVDGVRAAYRLRHGEGKYTENYKAEVQKKIANLLKKFPELEKDTTTPDLLDE